MTQPTEPRISRWHRASPEGLNIENLARVFDRSGSTFRWRPYNNGFYEGFMSQLYGKDIVRHVNMYINREALAKFVHCIRVSEMVGVDEDCIEQYQPHRVAMQFGFDQDIPVWVARENGSSDIAWLNYLRPLTDVVIQVPQRFCQPQVTTRYYTCWRRSMMIRLEGEPRTRNVVGRGGRVPPRVGRGRRRRRSLGVRIQEEEEEETAPSRSRDEVRPVVDRRRRRESGVRIQEEEETAPSRSRDEVRPVVDRRRRRESGVRIEDEETSQTRSRTRTVPSSSLDPPLAAIPLAYSGPTPPVLSLGPGPSDPAPAHDLVPPPASSSSSSSALALVPSPSADHAPIPAPSGFSPVLIHALVSETGTVIPISFRFVHPNP